MAVQIQLRRGTAAQWTSANPTLASGEVGVETDTNKQKIGDGTTAWNSLAYFNVNGISFGTTGLTPSTSTAGNVTVAGTLNVANGGTGLTTIPAGNVVIGNGTSALYGVAPGTAGNVLTSIAGVWTSNAAVGGGGSPGGSTTQVQFNNAGSFAGDGNLTFSGSTLTSANLIVSNLTVSQAVFSSATKQLVSNPITGTGSVVMNASPIITSPSLITPALGSPTSGNMSATTNIPVANATGTLAVANGGTGVTVSTGSGSVVLNTSPTLTTPTLISPVLGTPTSGSLVATTNIPVANATGTLAVANGGTGLTSTPANGALDIGNGTNFTRTTLTAGTNVTITNGAGSITIAASGGSGSPGGSSGQIQYNNAGAFGGFANLTYSLTGPIVATTIGVGGATPSTSGSGITFPATQSSSSNVNTLDDYEEGTWTASLGGTATYSAQTGTYTKVGNIVTITFRLTVLLIGTGSAANISGIPFPISTITAGPVGYWNSAASSFTSLALSNGGSTSLNFSGTTAGQATVTYGASVFQNSTDLWATATYLTAT
jgi:hypothetical protein